MANGSRRYYFGNTHRRVHIRLTSVIRSLPFRLFDYLHFRENRDIALNFEFQQSRCAATYRIRRLLSMFLARAIAFLIFRAAFVWIVLLAYFFLYFVILSLNFLLPFSSYQYSGNPCVELFLFLLLDISRVDALRIAFTRTTP